MTWRFFDSSTLRVQTDYGTCYPEMGYQLSAYQLSANQLITHKNQIRFAKRRSDNMQLHRFGAKLLGFEKLTEHVIVAMSSKRHFNLKVTDKISLIRRKTNQIQHLPFAIILSVNFQFELGHHHAIRKWLSNVRIWSQVESILDKEIQSLMRLHRSRIVLNVSFRHPEADPRRKRIQKWSSPELTRYT